MIQSVSAGQLWELAAQAFGAFESFRVERVDGGMAFGTMVSGGRAASFKVSTLARGLRSSRLVQNADGTRYHKPAPAMRTQEREPTASDFRRLQPPRGLTAAEREAWLRDKQ
jgi:hypothetical protein